MEKKLFDLGLIKNREKYVQDLQDLTGDNNISNTDIDDFINDNLQKNYYDENGKGCNENDAVYFTFHTPFKTPENEDIYGTFYRVSTEKGWMGVLWQTESTFKKYVIEKCIQNITNTKACWEKINKICGQEITNDNIWQQISFPITKYTCDKNGVQSKEKNTTKYVLYKTDLKKGNSSIWWWFAKDKGAYTYIDFGWGTKNDFNKIAKSPRIGRIIFESIDKMNVFLNNLAKKLLPENWGNKNRILKSYIEYELDRLLYEEQHGENNKIVYNSSGYMCFNTNLLNKFGFDLFIYGKIYDSPNTYNDNLYILGKTIKTFVKSNVEDFFTVVPKTPNFFDSINDIIFQNEWGIDDDDSNKLEHIIIERRNRFPEDYKSKNTALLAQRLKDAISWSKKIASRDYKFIVPIYYPTKCRIQLLMPIYLDGMNNDSDKPDFALVLTPKPDQKKYSLETILGLSEAYQDARLIAKPSESWLTKSILQNDTDNTDEDSEVEQSLNEESTTDANEPKVSDPINIEEPLHKPKAQTEKEEVRKNAKEIQKQSKKAVTKQESKKQGSAPATKPIQEKVAVKGEKPIVQPEPKSEKLQGHNIIGKIDISEYERKQDEVMSQKMKQKLSALVDKYNVAASTIVEYLVSHGVEIEENNPNAKVQPEWVALLDEKFKNAKATNETTITDTMQMKRPHRLSALANKYNVESSTIVEYLASKGVEIENNPNAKVQPELVALLDEKFKNTKA